MSSSMLTQRAMQTSMRRLIAVNTANKSLRFISPASIALGQYRPAASLSSNATPVSASQAQEILAAQRKHRPIAPHLSIYQPQVTWILSILNRITGCILSGGLYIYGFGYLVAPYVGLHWESASVAAAFAAWPIAAKVAAKFALAWPFTYHSLNGIRHLVWDTGAAFTNKQVIVTGWSVVAVSFVTALGLTFY